MAESEKFTVEVDVKASDAVKELENVEKTAKKTEKGLGGLKDTGTASGNALTASFKRLAGAFGLVLSAGAVVSFIKRVAEANMLLGQMAVKSSQSEKSLRAMQNQFKALGYSASEANGLVDDFAGSFAALKFGGELTGITKGFADLGVAVMDAQGKARDLYDMAIEAGEFALGFTGGDRESAMQLMMSRGISPALADLATREDAKEQAAAMKRQAAASREMAQSTEKLSSAMAEMENALEGAVIQLNKNWKIFDGMGDAVKAMIPAVQLITDVLLEIGKVFSAVKNAIKALLKPVLDKVDGLAEKLDEKVKAGEKTPIVDWLNNAGEAGNTDYDYDPDEARKKAAQGRSDGQSTQADSGDVRNRIKENIMKRENVKLKAYQDSGGVWTIGWGHTAGVKPGMTITKDQARAFLDDDLKKHVDPALKMYEGYSDKTKMLAADLAYNAGLGSIQKNSRFHKLAQAGDISASDYSKLYITASGKYSPGLVNRRNWTYAEASKIPTPAQVMPRVQPVAYAEKTAPATANAAGSSIVQNINVYAPTGDSKDIVTAFRDKTQTIGALTSSFV